MFFCMPHSAEFWLSIGSLVNADLPVGHYLVVSELNILRRGENKCILLYSLCVLVHNILL